jgi:hypothetical protein
MADITFPTFPVSKALPFTIAPVDETGTFVPGDYQWQVSDPAVATVSVAANTLSAILIPMVAGSVTLTVTDGSITDTASGSMSSVAVALNLNFGVPINKP